MNECMSMEPWWNNTDGKAEVLRENIFDVGSNMVPQRRLSTLSLALPAGSRLGLFREPE